MRLEVKDVQMFQKYLSVKMRKKSLKVKMCTKISLVVVFA